MKNYLGLACLVALLTVGCDDPLSVGIVSPAKAAQFAQGASITFKAEARYWGSLVPMAIYRWDSSLDGFLGMGAVLQKSNLSLGIHDITVTATLPPKSYGDWPKKEESRTATVVIAVVQGPVDIQFLTVSDWHAQLDPMTIPQVGNIGGAAVLSTYFKAERQANPNTLTFAAGDSFGASPPLAAFFKEEPAVKAMNLMGFDADTFGNHNFDRGVAHLHSMIELAQFKYVSANLLNVEQNLCGVTPFVIKEVGGIRVAVIGITNPEAATLTFPGMLGTMQVTDPVEAAMKARADAKAAGAQVVVCLVHMGAVATDAGGQPIGPLMDFASKLSGFDIIFGDHTDFQVNMVINGALVVENRSKGRTYAKVGLKVKSPEGTILDHSVQFVTPLSTAVTPDPAVEAMLAPYRTQLAAVFDGVVGASTDIFVRDGTERLKEVPIGDLVADAIRLRYTTQLAFTNGGGIRAPLPSSYLPMNKSLRRTAPGYVAGPPYDLVIGDVYAMLPFGNVIVTRTVTGAQLWAMLEHGVSALPASAGFFGQISGFKFAFDSSHPAGARVISITLDDGTPIAADSKTYSLATSDFLNEGGDGYTMLNDGSGVTREVMAVVVKEYVQKLGTLTPKVDGRIKDVKP